MTAEIHKQHGGAYDRGSADRYYKRSYNPHYRVYTQNPYSCETITSDKMTAEELEAYAAGWNEEKGEKDYGDYYEAEAVE